MKILYLVPLEQLVHTDQICIQNGDVSPINGKRVADQENAGGTAKAAVVTTGLEKIGQDFGIPGRMNLYCPNTRDLTAWWTLSGAFWSTWMQWML